MGEDPWDASALCRLSGTVPYRPRLLLRLVPRGWLRNGNHQTEETSLHVKHV